ncbi:hypothetical protein [Treponema endosymbiont of Eucomonympha sp.]|uniref:hypothetical protein n=1 Tax=Treponema endosymbiont of Eucomonympha sp. TaxID=1580831 RepID=UPI001E511205|nr:hypothetical protein [Treponema endosymbiont of Eucomonympha sp.]
MSCSFCVCLYAEFPQETRTLPVRVTQGREGVSASPLTRAPLVRSCVMTQPKAVIGKAANPLPL